MEQAIAEVIKNSWSFLFPLLMAITAETKSTAVIPFIEAYIGGKKESGSILIPKSRSFTLNKIATNKL